MGFYLEICGFQWCLIMSSYLCLVDLLTCITVVWIHFFFFLGFCHGRSVFLRYSRSRDCWNLFCSCYSPSDRKLTSAFLSGLHTFLFGVACMALLEYSYDQFHRRSEEDEQPKPLSMFLVKFAPSFEVISELSSVVQSLQLQCYMFVL